MTTLIHQKRRRSGLSQEAVAQAIGISRPTYNKIEKGTVQPNETQKAILGRILSVSSQSLDNAQENNLKFNDRIELREIPEENIQKFKEVLLYILGKVGSRPNISQTALYKLLYFIDFDYYEKHELQLVGATYIKNTYGPTPISFAKIIKEMERAGSLVEVKSKYFDLDQTKYIPVHEANLSCLNGLELQHIDAEIERLAHLTARQLSDLSHKDTPWLVAKNKEVLDYEYVFYRPEETSVRVYEQL